MAETKEVYRVLARKYRPQNFDELIGQDALVRTLKNAITSGRIAHAFMLTGVRGVGKTTTARIIAKALNYRGPDGKSEATIGSTDDCSLCQAISEDRHPDVIEMDAASRTGVDDIREILDGVRYAPTEARYKVYIIDEVHMLSKQAFNALLKTLEEPPEHVKFIFATTEIRKVPITVLSRCQRFDLRRIAFEELCTHFKNICGLENVEAEDDAISMIARAADGSVRDGLSLLDQAIALSNGTITAELVQSMLGLSDRVKTLDLIEQVLTGDLPAALATMDDIYNNGGAPSVVMQDLLELTHLLTKIRAVPDIANLGEGLSSDMMERTKDLSGKLSMPTLGKAWQILLKGLGEVNDAPNPQSAAEMVIIRLAYAADLPDPGDLIKRLKDNSGTPGNTAGSPQTPQGSPAPAEVAQLQTVTPAEQPKQPQEKPKPAMPEQLETIEDVVHLLEAHGELILAGHLFQFAHPVKFSYKDAGENAGGHLEFRPKPEASPTLAQDLTKTLKHLTGHMWLVTLSTSAGQPTLAETEEQKRLAEIEEVSQHPAVSDILRTFPDAEIVEVKRPQNFNRNMKQTNTFENKQSKEQKQ